MATGTYPNYPYPSQSAIPPAPPAVFPRSNSHVDSDERIARLLQAEFDAETKLVKLRKIQGGKWREGPSSADISGYVATPFSHRREKPGGKGSNGGAAKARSQPSPDSTMAPATVPGMPSTPEVPSRDAGTRGGYKKSTPKAPSSNAPVPEMLSTPQVLYRDAGTTDGLVVETHALGRGWASEPSRKQKEPQQARVSYLGNPKAPPHAGSTGPVAPPGSSSQYRGHEQHLRSTPKVPPPPTGDIIREDWSSIPWQNVGGHVGVPQDVFLETHGYPGGAPEGPLLTIESEKELSSSPEMRQAGSSRKWQERDLISFEVMEGGVSGRRGEGVGGGSGKGMSSMELWDATVWNVGGSMSDPARHHGEPAEGSQGWGRGGGAEEEEEEEERKAAEEANEAAALSVVMQELGLDTSPSFSRRSASIRHRLARTESIPHVMRVNSIVRPSVEEELSEHERLQRNLQQYALREIPIVGDGNCQFRALADQLYGSEKKHMQVRKAVIVQLKTWRSRYAPYVPESYDAYIKTMAKNGTWGDHVTLQAASDRYKAKITLITSYKEKFVVEILPKGGRPVVEAWLSYYAETHYNSVYPVENKLGSNMPKKSHWLLDLF